MSAQDGGWLVGELHNLHWESPGDGDEEESCDEEEMEEKEDEKGKVNEKKREDSDSYDDEEVEENAKGEILTAIKEEGKKAKRKSIVRSAK